MCNDCFKPSRSERYASAAGVVFGWLFIILAFLSVMAGIVWCSSFLLNNAAHAGPRIPDYHGRALRNGYSPFPFDRYYRSYRERTHPTKPNQIYVPPRYESVPGTNGRWMRQTR